MSRPLGPLCWVAPPLDGPLSGGTLYNRELCRALDELEQPVQVRALDAPDLRAVIARARYTWVDSLYLGVLPELARVAPRRVGLLAHYLPTFVALGRAAAPSELARDESEALSAASALLVTSDFMREALEPLVATPKTCCVVEPGSHARLAAAAPFPSAVGLRALIIANLVPGKGILPLLGALHERLQSSDRIELTIVGSRAADAPYAERCRAAIASSSELASRVTLRGALEPDQVQTELAAAQLLLSASAMESYGMALAEARVTGVPILTLAGGNSARHVDRAAGGEWVSSIAELAAACLELTRTPRLLTRRIEQARRAAVPARSWQRAARELLDQLEALEK